MNESTWHLYYHGSKPVFRLIDLNLMFQRESKRSNGNVAITPYEREEDVR